VLHRRTGDGVTSADRETSLMDRPEKGEYMRKTITGIVLAMLIAALCLGLAACVETGTGTDFDSVAPKSSVSESLEKVITGED